jgi:recombination protein RecR
MAEKYPPALAEIINILKTLPGVGKRSAERMALTMLKWPKDKLKALGRGLETLKEKVTDCPQCGNLSTDNQLCAICSAPGRNNSMLCVVEESTQIFSIEASGLYHGFYHVLGGKLSPLEGRNADNLNINSLLERLADGPVKEVIIALSPDVEGQATAIYISELMQKYDLKITRLAQGLPAGSDISYADSATIAAAFNGRVSL